FPRLFVIQKFVISFGAIAPGSTGATTPAGASSSAAPGAPPLWTGGTPTAPSAAPYNLAITGSIYYTSTPSALAACTKAIEVSK
ncbi:MAG TPA: hypothetical protein VG054_10250, partial [Acidimicrobiales bacterium]|nr:hypothetical protein [Acidimicrobiales bacterium]